MVWVVSSHTFGGSRMVSTCAYTGDLMFCAQKSCCCGPPRTLHLSTQSSAWQPQRILIWVNAHPHSQIRTYNKTRLNYGFPGGAYLGLFLDWAL